MNTSLAPHPVAMSDGTVMTKRSTAATLQQLAKRVAVLQSPQ